MPDINSYANDLLLDFLDSAHDQIRTILQEEFGESWFTEGIQRHIHSQYFIRTREMLDSPMSVVDMGKTDEELYGVEHLSSIIIGNWPIFEDKFGTRNRTEVYLGEISELRHNVSHRRQHHLLQRGDLWRFIHNAQLILAALDSPAATRFESIATTILQGGSPWGNQLGGTLPPASEIVAHFVGREQQINQLSSWLTTDSGNQLLIWGYGGSGKSALAYQFARAVRDGAPSDLQAVVWLSAKSKEFIEGEPRDRIADFDSVASFAQALWVALYDYGPSPQECTSEATLQELIETPSLVIVDDLDSILDQQDLSHFLLFEVPRSKSKFIYTTRHTVPGISRLEVSGFEGQELRDFIANRATSYHLSVDEYLARANAIHSVTDGFPLFVDDLLRHAVLTGLEDAIADWSHRKGDAAREYALRRQLSSLGEASRRALLGVAVANRPISSLELSNISGFTDDDIQDAIKDLLRWRLISRLDADATGRPTFSCNRNTHRLVLKTYGRDPIYSSYQASFKTLTGSTTPAALRKAVGTTISKTRALTLRGDYTGAAAHIRSAMTGELENNCDLWSFLGLVLSRQRSGASTAEARTAFQRSHELGSRNEDTYFHWVDMEREIAESLVNQSEEAVLLKQWRFAAQVAEFGIERCGETSALCQLIAYLRSREAKTLGYLNEFTSAQNCYRQAAEWAQRALDTPLTSTRDITPSQIFRTLIVALEGVGEPDKTLEALKRWEMSVENEDPIFRREYDRLHTSLIYPDPIS